MTTKKDIFEEHLPAWLKARGNRKKRGEITDHMCFVTGMHRNSVSRKFKALQIRDPGREEQRGRAVYYGAAVTAALLDLIVQTAYGEAKRVGEFTLPGLGKFVKKQRAARKGRNPATGAEIQIPAKTVVKFRVAKAAKDSVLG